MSVVRYKGVKKELTGLSSIQVSMPFPKHVLRFLGITKFHKPSHGAPAARQKSGPAAHHPEVAPACRHPSRPRRHAPDFDGSKHR
ncbi:hypothetical protein CBM2586_B130753 [Cupriavidus phytorum]|uniref:Uncharacterized protein n=1 Tax=Cupriavidus taiwanensis TaxID=164546 RepID=A0A375CJZ7_9BURK|nr:hypothetical protein CBM2586_B130753 [Cupriavidus taiwanensis]